MKDRKAEFLTPLIVSSPKKSEIFHKAVDKDNGLGLTTNFELDPLLVYKKNIFCLREFFFEKNDGFLKPDIFTARMEHVNAACRPVWDCLWENKDSMNLWKDFNLVFRETFQDKDLVVYILVFTFEDNEWKYEFKKLSDYKFTKKDRAVCIV